MMSLLTELDAFCNLNLQRCQPYGLEKSVFIRAHPWLKVQMPVAPHRPSPAWFFRPVHRVHGTHPRLLWMLPGVQTPAVVQKTSNPPQNSQEPPFPNAAESGRNPAKPFRNTARSFRNTAKPFCHTAKPSGNAAVPFCRVAEPSPSLSDHPAVLRSHLAILQNRPAMLRSHFAILQNHSAILRNHRPMLQNHLAILRNDTLGLENGPKRMKGHLRGWRLPRYRTRTWPETRQIEPARLWSDPGNHRAAFFYLG